MPGGGGRQGRGADIKKTIISRQIFHRAWMQKMRTRLTSHHHKVQLCVMSSLGFCLKLIGFSLQVRSFRGPSCRRCMPALCGNPGRWALDPH